MIFTRRLRWCIGAIIALLGFIWWYTLPAGHETDKNKPILVKVAPVVIKPMPLTIISVGTVEAEQSVAIIPQVTGVIKKIDFQEGQLVQAGQPLFELDASTELASLQQAQALLMRDKAQLDVDQANAKRYAALVKLEYVTEQDYEQMQAAAAAQSAVVAADAAQVQQAQIELSYSKLSAPITGKTGDVEVKVGDLVTANSPTPLVVINSLDTVLVDFSIPQGQLPIVMHYQRGGNLKVVISEQGSMHQPLAIGVLNFIDNSVNQQTGTVLLKAFVDNKQQVLWPGELLKVTLLLAMQPHAIVIPASAVQLDEQGSFVYLAKAGAAVVQRIKVARQIGDEAVIAEGLTGNETIITEIPPDLTEGNPIEIYHAPAPQVIGK